MSRPYEDVNRPVHQKFRRSTQSTQNTKGVFKEVGYVTSDGAIPIPEEYLVRVSSQRHRSTVISPIQGDVMMEVNSHWGPFVPQASLQHNVAVQAATAALQRVGVTSRAQSMITRASSRRIWTGTEPLTFSLKLRFEAVENAVQEVLEPIRVLQSMALPSGPKGGVKVPEGLSDVGETAKGVINLFLSPPGPTPFLSQDILYRSVSGGEVTEEYSSSVTELGDRIILEIGRFLTFFNVIISRVQVVVPPKFTPGGNPVSATVNLVVQTYQMMTVEDMDNAYRKTSVSEPE